MLKQKALTQKTTATYCTTSNTIFVHSNKQKSKNVHSNNVLRVIRNCNAAQLAAYKQLPQTYMQNAKRFPHAFAQTLQKIILN